MKRKRLTYLLAAVSLMAASIGWAQCSAPELSAEPFAFQFTIADASRVRLKAVRMNLICTGTEWGFIEPEDETVWKELPLEVSQATTGDQTTVSVTLRRAQTLQSHLNAFRYSSRSCHSEFFVSVENRELSTTTYLHVQNRSPSEASRALLRRISGMELRLGYEKGNCHGSAVEQWCFYYFVMRALDRQQRQFWCDAHSFVNVNAANAPPHTPGTDCAGYHPPLEVFD